MKNFLPKPHKMIYVLFFEHDPTIECCTLQMTDKDWDEGKFFRLEFGGGVISN
jgi:hypothetical protein